MGTLTITILLITAFFVLFALLYVSIQYQELEKRFRLLAGSQVALSESQTALSESQTALSESHLVLSESHLVLAEDFEALSKDCQDLVKEHKDLRKKYEFIAKAQQQQAIANLQRQLFTLVGGNQITANGLIEIEKTANPGRSESWYLKKVTFDLQRNEYKHSH
ncbi:hypothetical protein [Chlorogloea sp. CCALA 695]|uniref:hypothetical protein n=1 Tax=Chlorogloea sp. CCALA 695 TaxID=2107693 RepID=UPI000D04B0F3|nr:hypothetical protein [Chlorogloea sp. CCALA 695]PSB26931.1 hypothetical protein C7B70_23260 [Chlorogloea sp. CCALA 695]